MKEIMDVGDIAFPHLHLYLENVPKTVTVFGFPIAFYGMIIGLGVVLGVLMAVREAKVTGQDPEVYWDFALYAIFFCILGSRIYYVVFSWDMYKDNLLEIFNLRHGGLAIYGTVIAAFLTAGIYCHVKKLSFLRLCDTGIVGLILGQIIGRWGNFMNREAFGQYTDSLFAMRLPIDAVRPGDISAELSAHILEGTNYIQVHPTFLYESVWNLLVLVFLMAYRKHKKFQGEVALLYLGGYGLGRCVIEGLRTDQLLIGHTDIAVSQVLAGALVIFALLVEITVRKRPGKSKS